MPRRPDCHRDREDRSPPTAIKTRRESRRLRAPYRWRSHVPQSASLSARSARDDEHATTCMSRYEDERVGKVVDGEEFARQNAAFDKGLATAGLYAIVRGAALFLIWLIYTYVVAHTNPCAPRQRQRAPSAVSYFSPDYERRRWRNTVARHHRDLRRDDAESGASLKRRTRYDHMMPISMLLGFIAIFVVMMLNLEHR